MRRTSSRHRKQVAELRAAGLLKTGPDHRPQEGRTAPAIDSDHIPITGRRRPRAAAELNFS